LTEVKENKFSYLKSPFVVKAQNTACRYLIKLCINGLFTYGYLSKSPFCQANYDAFKIIRYTGIVVINEKNGPARGRVKQAVRLNRWL
jgi:hypothetical protein